MKNYSTLRRSLRLSSCHLKRHQKQTHCLHFYLLNQRTHVYQVSSCQVLAKNFACASNGIRRVAIKNYKIDYHLSIKMSLELMKITNLSDFKELERRFTERWLDLEQNSNAFRYKLNVKKQKNLDGKLHFLLQVRKKYTSNNL